MTSLMCRRSVIKWLDNNSLTAQMYSVKALDYSIIPQGGDVDIDDYIMVKSLITLLPAQMLRALECDVTTLVAEIDTIR